VCVCVCVRVCKSQTVATVCASGGIVSLVGCKALSLGSSAVCFVHGGSSLSKQLSVTHVGVGE
jgi:hypothetical protein